MVFLKRTIYFFIIIFLLGISGLQIATTSLFVFAAPNEQVEQLDISQAKIQQKYQKADKIKKEYKMQKASFVKEAKDENAIAMEIGDKTKDEFVPEMTIRKWDDEVNFNIKYKHNVAKEDQSFELDGKKIKWKNHKTEVHFYEMEDMVFTELDSNGAEHEVSQKDLFEFDIILNEKPATNVVEMEIETKGLAFYYQPELTQKEKEDEAFRPENVVGSYAVYHESKRGDYSQIGGNNYMAGKAFHIYRPKIFDAEGKEVWGQLNINEEEGILSIEVSQDFLNNAVYPVRVDPTFGYNTQGASDAPLTYTGSLGKRSYRIGNPSAGFNGTVDSISFWWYSTHSDIPIDLSVFINEENSVATSSHGQIATAEEIDVTPPTTYTLKTVNLSSEHMSTGKDYIINILGNGWKGSPSTAYRTYVKADTVDTVSVYSEMLRTGSSSDYVTLKENPWTEVISQSQYYKWSIYCTYTAAPDYSVMSSNSYTIQSDSINFGGGWASSTSYILEDTLGEIATGVSASSSYNLHAGYQQMYETYISMTSAADVTLSPSIGGVTGGAANGSTTVTVTTDSVAGYELSIKASSSPALSSALDNFPDYTTASASVPDFTFSIAATSSEFGFSPEGGDIVTKYKDDGFVCNVNSNDTSDKCWEGLSTVDELIAKSTTANHPNGAQTTIKFRAQSGSSHIQIAGDYTATTTITAIAL